MARTWKPAGKGGPTTVADLKTELIKLAKKRKGFKLVDDKFKKDHLFLGHTKGDILKLSTALSKLRSVPFSTLMISSMESTAQAEVLNWIAKIPDGKLTFAKGTWTINTSRSAVSASNSYKFATVDLDALKGMDDDDIVKKSRKWYTVSSKFPKVACQFDSDGTPMI